MSRPSFFLPSALFLFALAASADDKPQRWTEVRSRNFVVVTNAAEKQARTVLNQFEQIRALFQNTYRVRVDPGKPIIILAAKDEKTLRELLPEFWEDKERKKPAGIFQEGKEKHYVALRLDTQGEQPYHVVYHEYIHLLTKLNYQSLPLWLNEGLAEFYGNTAFRGEEIDVGGVAVGQLLHLREQRLLPLQALFEADHTSPFYSKKDKASVFYGQSWALTHYMILGERAAASKQLLEFIALLGQGLEAREATAKAFPDLPQLERKLRDYIGQNRFQYLRIKSPVKPEAVQATARELPPAESAAIRGDFYVHTKRLKEARAALEEALRLDPNLAAAHESMAFLHFRNGERAEAAESLERAVALDSRSYLAHYYHAMLSGTAEGDARMIETHLRRAIELNPGFAPAYSALAGVLAAREATLEEAYKLAYQAFTLEPGVVAHRLNLAHVWLRKGQPDQALRVVERALATATEDDDRQAAETFLAQLKRFQEQKELAEERERQHRARIEERDRKLAEAQKPATQPREGEVIETTVPTVQQPDYPKADEIFFDGMVQSVTCKSTGAMDLILKVDQTLITFRAQDWKKVRLSSLRGTIMPGFSLCRDIREMKVRAVYEPVKGSALPGELIAVELGP